MFLQTCTTVLHQAIFIRFENFYDPEQQINLIYKFEVLNTVLLLPLLWSSGVTILFNSTIGKLEFNFQQRDILLNCANHLNIFTMPASLEEIKIEELYGALPATITNFDCNEIWAARSLHRPSGPGATPACSYQLSLSFLPINLIGHKVQLQSNEIERCHLLFMLLKKQ